MHTILVTGGTGTLGKEVVRQLVDNDNDVRVLSSQQNPDLPEEVTLFSGNLATGVGLQKAVDGAEIIIHCASNPREPQGVDINGTRHLINAAKHNEVRHFIYISIVGIEKSDYPYYRSKAKAERIIRKSGIPWSILRTTQFHDFILSIIKSFEINHASIIVPEGMQFQSVDIREVANRLVTLSEEKPKGRLPDMGGPQILSIEKMTGIYLKTNSEDNVKIISKTTEDKLHDVFRTGINLFQNKQQGKITWKEFLQFRLNI